MKYPSSNPRCICLWNFSDGMPYDDDGKLVEGLITIRIDSKCPKHYNTDAHLRIHGSDTYLQNRLVSVELLRELEYAEKHRNLYPTRLELILLD